MYNIVLADGTISDDRWTMVESSDEGTVELPEGPAIVPLAWWLENQDQLSARNDVGVWFDSSDEPESLGEKCQPLPIIAVNFPKFTDGRGYSIARLLRERYHFPHELRAIGDVLLDQLFFMKRCGFDSFKLRADKDINKAPACLGAFDETYQAAFDQKDPLFRRRV